MSDIQCGRMKISLLLFAVIVLLLTVVPLRISSAKVPDTFLKEEAKPTPKDTYMPTRKMLLQRGYKKKVYGLDVGYIKPGFELQKGTSVRIQPIKNDVQSDYADLVDTFSELVGDTLVTLMRETEIFSAVTSDEDAPPQDLNVRVYVQELSTMDKWWEDDSRCVWGIDVYDKKGALVLAGFDLLLSYSLNRHIDFLTTDVPRLALLFICRNNKEFDKEYRRLRKSNKIK